MHIGWSFSQYSMMASYSFMAASLSSLKPASKASVSFESFVLYFTAVSFSVVAMALSCVSFSYSSTAMASAALPSASSLEKSLSTTSSMPIMPVEAPVALERFCVPIRPGRNLCGSTSLEEILLLGVVIAEHLERHANALEPLLVVRLRCRPRRGLLLAQLRCLLLRCSDLAEFLLERGNLLLQLRDLRGRLVDLR